MEAPPYIAPIGMKWVCSACSKCRSYNLERSWCGKCNGSGIEYNLLPVSLQELDRQLRKKEMDYAKEHPNELMPSMFGSLKDRAIVKWPSKFK